MTLPRSVAEILRDHVTLEVEGIDRMYLNAVVPILQTERGIAWFFRECRGYRFASSALMAPMTQAFVGALEDFARAEKLDIVSFERKQRKDDVAAEYRARFRGDEGLLFVGKAQEKASVFRTQRRRNPTTGATYAWLYRSTAMVNQYYFYAVDRDFGPFLLKFCSYFPYNAKLCINGHEYVKRQLELRGIAVRSARQRNPLVRGAGDAPEDLRPAFGVAHRWPASQVAASATASLHGEGPCEGHSLRRVDPSGRVLADPGPRPTSDRSRVLRRGHPGEPRHRPPRPGAADLRTQDRSKGTPRHSRSVPYPCHHGGCLPFAARGLQSHADQAVPQGEPRLADGDHDQQHPRLRHRQTADVYSTSNESATTARSENGGFTPFSARAW